MSPQTFLLRTSEHRARLIAGIGHMQIRGDRPFMVTFERVDLTRTSGQNRRLRTIEREISEHTGHDMIEVHERLLERKFGLEITDLGGGKIRVEPARRTSDMGVAEIEEYIEWVISVGVDLGVEFSQ